MRQKKNINLGIINFLILIIFLINILSSEALENGNTSKNILVEIKDIKINKKNITDENKILLLINLDLHKKS